MQQVLELYLTFDRKTEITDINPNKLACKDTSPAAFKYSDKQLIINAAAWSQNIKRISIISLLQTKGKQ